MEHTPNRLEGKLVAQNARIAIVCARFNEFIVSKLEAGALDALKRHGLALNQVDVAYVPGAHEIPIAVSRLAKTKKYDAIIALGAVIKGATPHFDVVVNESAKGISQVALAENIPVINGILTTNNIEQAVERAGTKAGNKGFEAGVCAVEMINLLREIG